MTVYCPFCGFEDKLAEIGCMFNCQNCKKFALLVDMNDRKRLDRWLIKKEIQGINGGITKFID